MRNPNYPQRKIRHAQLMKQAGFTIDKQWMNLHKRNPPVSPTCGVARLIYWNNSDGIQICIHDNDTITIKELIRRVVEQTKYHLKKRARIAWDSGE